MRFTATTAVKRLTPALLAAVAVSVLGSGAALAAKPSGGGTTSGGKTTKDTTPPSVSIASPTTGSTLSSSSATVDGSASDNVSVASVAVSVDGGTYATASGTTTWSDIVSSLSSGSHTIVAKATDGSGNSSTASITVSVSSGTGTGTGGGSTATPPTSTITQPPYDGATVAGSYTLTGASSDATYAVTREEWDVDGVAVASGTSTTGLSFAWDTSTVAQGSHTLTYRTWNSAGAEGDASRPVTVGSATVKRVADILYNFQGQTPPTTPQTVMDWTFTGSRSVAGYYREDTFGRLLLGGQYNSAGDVFGFYTIPYTEPTTATCDFTSWEASALQQAAAAGVNLKGYDVVMLTAAVPAGCGSGTGGGSQDRVPWNNPGTPDQWISFAAHELGHSFGIHHHSAAWTCTDSSGHTVQVSATCSSSEYGDPYDIMGGGGVEHMNAYELGQIGVLRPANVQTVTGAGTYTLNPVTAPSSGVQTIRIPRAYDGSGHATDYYYLEYRQPAAYDVAPSDVIDYNGVLLREAPDFSAASTVSNLVDTTPGSATLPWVHDNYDAALTPGRYFQDAAAGITVSIVSVSSGGATVQVSFGTPQCVRVAPTVSLSPASQTGAAGAGLSYTAIVANNDAPACGASTVDVAASLPAGFTQSPASTTISGLYPAGTVSTWNITVASSSTQWSGTYSFTETATNRSSGMSGNVTGTAVVQ